MHSSLTVQSPRLLRTSLANVRRSGGTSAGIRGRTVMLRSIARSLLIVLTGLSTASAAGEPSVTVETYGALRAMMHQGKTDAAVRLDALTPNPHLYGVGALEHLAGEVTIIGGNVYVSHPDGDHATRTTAATESDAGAALLVTADVHDWQTTKTTEPITFAELDDAIAALAEKAGWSLDERIPFLLEGMFPTLTLHVVDGSKLKGTNLSHEDHIKAAVQTTTKDVAANIVGFFSLKDAGVFTHMGSRTHLHGVIAGTGAAGHVDDITIPAGTTVRFPLVAR